MTYLQFLVVFTVVPIVVLVALLRGRIPRAAVAYAGLLSLVAFVYTAPWDNIIVLNQVWTYGPRQVLGVIVGVIPLEEYLFYGLQTVAAVLFCVWLRRRWRQADPDTNVGGADNWPFDPTRPA